MEALLVAPTSMSPVRQIDVVLKEAGIVRTLRLEDPVAIQAMMDVLERFQPFSNSRRAEGKTPALNK